MEKYFFGANWKSHMSLEMAKQFFHEWQALLSQKTLFTNVFFPTQYLLGYLQAHYGQSIQLGAQNSSSFSKGAFTGEVAAELLAMDNIHYALAGHSERRTLLGETNEQIAEKIQKNQKFSITSVLCVGESLEHRENSTYESFVSHQLSSSLQGVSPHPIIVAYEPLWAIGTGKTPTLDEIEQIHSLIADNLETLGFSQKTIIYGGSVNPSNAPDILAKPHVNGVLVGGASLNSQEFYSIASSMSD